MKNLETKHADFNDDGDFSKRFHRIKSVLVIF